MKYSRMTIPLLRRKCSESEQAKPHTFFANTVALALLLGSSFNAPSAFADHVTNADPGRPCTSGEADPCSTDATSPPTGNMPDSSVGNPINVMTGNKFQTETDFDIPGSMLTLRRVYNSADSGHNRGLGQGWSHTFLVTLTDHGNGVRQLIGGDGGRITFSPDGTNESGNPLYRAQQSNHGYLTYENERHLWRQSDGRVLTFKGSHLVKINWPDQRELKFYYRYGRLHTVTDETGRVMRFNYSDGLANTLGSYEPTRFTSVDGYLASVTLPDGSEIGYDYDSKRNLTRVRFPDGTSREYHYENENWPNHQTGLTDRTGVRFASWTYDEYGRANSSEYAGGAERVTIDFPELREVAQGHAVKTTVTNSLGHTSTFTWQQDHHATYPQLLSSDGAGCATCPETGFDYSYDDQGRLLSNMRLASGNAKGSGSVSYRYDTRGRISKKIGVDAEGVERTLEDREYENDSHLPVRIIEPSVRPGENRIRTFKYDSNGNTVSITESGWSPIVDDVSRFNGNTAAIESVERWQAIERTITREYDDKSRLISINGPREDVDDVLRIDWDEKNRAVAIKSPGVPAITNNAFNTLGYVTSFSIGNQNPVTINYNAQNLPEQITQFGRTLELSYDAETRITGYTSPDGAKTTLEYDDAGMLVKIIKPDGSSTQFDLNSEGQSVASQQFNRDGLMIKSVSTLFDALGRVESSRTEMLSARGNLIAETLQNTYDQNGHRTAVTNNETGRELRMQYNSLGMLASFNEPGALLDDEQAQLTDVDAEPLSARQTTSVEYDAAGNEVALIDRRGNRTVYLKDDFGQILVHHSADTGTTRYQYDAAGNRVQKTDADGDVTTYRWDAASRMIEKQREDALFTYGYDDVHGKLSESVAPATTERFAYDAHARLISHERIIDNQRFVTGFTYDENGRLLRKSLPDGQTLRYHYEETSGHTRGNLTTITRESLFGFFQETLIDQIDQDTADGTGGYVASNGLRTTHSYAPDGSMSAIDIDRVMQLKYEFDETGRIIGIDANGTMQQFQYSQHGLSSAKSDIAIYRFEYDDMGNRSARSVEGKDGAVSATRYDYVERGYGNRLLSETTLSGDAISNEEPLLRHDSRLYSNSGATKQMNGFRYEYNSAQRPIMVFDGGKLLAEYAYNGFGERIKKVVYSGNQKKVTYYLYDGNTLSAEIDADSNSFKQAVFLDNTPVAYLVAKNTFAIHSDHLGTPQLATDMAGEVVWTAVYDPFGAATIASTSTLDLPYRFSGQYADAETGTHYNYFRDYDPGTGRYITSDPIGLHGGLNTYAYVSNEPLNWTDPLGLIGGPGPPVTNTTDTPEKPTPADEQKYTDKLIKVLDYAIANLAENADANIKKVLTNMRDEALFMGVIIAAVALNPAAAPILMAGAWLLAGYSAAKFLFNTVNMLVTLRTTDLCDEEALEAMGNQLGGSIGNLATDILSSALLGGVTRLGGALRDAAKFAGDGAWTLWKKLKARFNKDVTNSGICSFAGDTLVVTDNGYMPIRDIRAQRDKVWARDELTGTVGWQDVLAQYSNRYEETVHVTALDSNGKSQTIKSNRIHPYFARIAAAAILTSAGATTAASEGHIYSGDIAGGAWVDAQHLKVGDDLLDTNRQWQRVVSVVIENQPLDAYNLTVKEYSTFFVAGTQRADAVWVHNTCYTGRPDGFTDTAVPTDFGQKIIVSPDGRTLYQGHPPNDNNWYDPATSPPTAHPAIIQGNSVNISGGVTWQKYQAEIQNVYTGYPSRNRNYVDHNGVNRQADHVYVDGNKVVAVDAKHVGNWENSIYNPYNASIANKPFAIEARQKEIDKFIAYSKSFDEFVIHTNSPELATYYIQKMAQLGITNAKFVLTTVN